MKRRRLILDPKVNPEAERILRGLYEFKESLVKRNQAFSKEEFLKGLDEIGLPRCYHFWLTFFRVDLPVQGCKLLTKVRKNAFVFTKPNDPIHWKDLQALYKAYRETSKKYKATYKAKQRKTAEATDSSVEQSPESKAFFDSLRKPVKKTEDGTEMSSQIQEAINLLKSHGFEVLAPVAMLYAKM